ncbi:uncharacterized protein F5147DRAFT_242896 [Suillus discolor]|uniref:Uncharacterized protein n=1 Tax=Suillus discolor TaxID=1912936 RepID=A0A9P7F4H6_9AGAM|nr:uncharacterized protein F5147DRAFT_242896 [Suillus discolor]KAG2105534.1 hypothetical protein F5147DRAFT_242896 [Suillus discolor]
MAIYTSLALPTVIVHLSGGCVHWSDDRQARITTEVVRPIILRTLWDLSLSMGQGTSSLHSDPGINFSTPPDIKSPRGDEQGQRPFGWFRAMIKPVTHVAEYISRLERYRSRIS